MKIEEVKKMSIEEKMFHITVELEVKKDTKNDYVGFSYASLQAIHEALKPLQLKYRVWFKLGSAEAVNMDGRDKPDWKATLIAVNIDDPNQKEELTLQIPEHKLTGGGTSRTQEVGATITYLTRYLYRTMLNIADQDDVDQNTGKKDKAKQEPKQESKKFEKSPEDQKKIDKLNSLDKDELKELLKGYKSSKGYPQKDPKWLKPNELQEVYDKYLVLVGNKQIGEERAQALSDKMGEVLGDSFTDILSEELERFKIGALRELTNRQLKELCKRHNLK